MGPDGFRAALAGRRAELALLALWAGVTAAGVVTHEPFRDEAQKWLIARDAPGVGALVALAPAEGSPALWTLLLRPLARLGAPYAAMSWLNWLFAAAAGALLWLRAPLPRALRLLALFSYFLLYDLPVIARNYALATALLFASVALFPARGRRPIAYAGLLALLMHANVFAAAVGAALGGVHLLDLGRSRRGWRAAAPAGLLLAVAAGSFLMQVVPRDGWGTLLELLAAPSLGLGPTSTPGLALTPRMALANLLAYYPWLGWGGHAVAAGVVLAAAALLLVVAAGLADRPRALVVLAAAVAPPAWLVTWKAYHSPQYFGALLFGAIAALWFAALEARPQAARRPRLAATLERLRRLALRLVLVPLALSAVLGVFAAAADYRRTFSGARDAARFIAGSGLASLPLAAWPGYLCTAALPWLDGAKCYHVDDDREATFVRQDRLHRAGTRKSASLLRRRLDARMAAPRFLLLVNGRVPELEDRCRPLYAATDVIHDERFVVYGCAGAGR